MQTFKYSDSIWLYRLNIEMNKQNMKKSSKCYVPIVKKTLLLSQCHLQIKPVWTTCFSQNVLVSMICKGTSRKKQKYICFRYTVKRVLSFPHSNAVIGITLSMKVIMLIRWCHVCYKIIIPRTMLIHSISVLWTVCGGRPLGW